MLSFGVECATDIASLRALSIAAFGGKAEADLVDVIRQSPNFIPELSLVARDEGEAIAHILFSRIMMEGRDRTVSPLPLAPLAVTPQRQNQGFEPYRWDHLALN